MIVIVALRLSNPLEMRACLDGYVATRHAICPVLRRSATRNMLSARYTENLITVVDDYNLLGNRVAIREHDVQYTGAIGIQAVREGFPRRERVGRRTGSYLSVEHCKVLL